MQIYSLEEFENLLVEMAQAALNDDDMAARACGLEFERAARQHAIADLPRPNLDDGRVLITCAAFAELFAERLGQRAPAWTAGVGGLDTRFIFFPTLRKYPEMLPDLVLETPEPLRRRNMVSTRNYLRHV